MGSRSSGAEDCVPEGPPPRQFLRQRQAPRMQRAPSRGVASGNESGSGVASRGSCVSSRGRAEEAADSSDDAAAPLKENDCRECGIEIKDGEPRYKKQMIHLHCGKNAGANSHLVATKHPKLVEAYSQLRKKKTKSYQKFMAGLPEKTKHARVAQDQCDALISLVKHKEAITRKQRLKVTDAYWLFTEEQWIDHMKAKKQWKHRRAQKEYERP